jgi:Protein of unknown function (DUF2817)
MNSVDSFSTDYAMARRKFREASAENDAVMEAFRHPEPGPDGEELFVDTSWIGACNAESVLVLISATHGVEGFCGSGAQVDFLRRGEARNLPTNMAVLLIHAINPYGFAWLRRTTHENVDLNRNWVDFNAPLPVNEGYRRLHASLCPAQWTEAACVAGEEALQAFESEMGRDAAKQALGGGQYEYPTGLYYGGSEPSWSRRTQTDIFLRCLGRAKKIAVIDYHTGLGPWGFAEEIMTASASSAAFRRASQWYGTTVKSTADGTSVGARIGGDGLSGAAALLHAAEVTAIALEFGTLPRQAVVNANREDSWLHAHDEPRSSRALAIKQRLRDAYYGDRDDWKGMVAGQSLLVCRQAIAGLSL